MRNKEFNPGMGPKLTPPPAPMPPVYPTAPVQPAGEQKDPLVQPADPGTASEESWSPEADTAGTPVQPEPAAAGAERPEPSVSPESSMAAEGSSEPEAGSVQPETAVPDQEKNDNMF